MGKCCRYYFVLIICLVLTAALSAESLRAQNGIMFWNLENFFDYFDDGRSSSDSDFSSRGVRRWTKSRFTKKCAMVGKTLLWAGERYSSDAEPPDLVGVCEVENSFVLRRLVHTPVLEKVGYGYVHYDSPDRRGIDVALLYRKGRVRVLSSRAVHICRPDGCLMPTRDILYAYVEIVQNDGKVRTGSGDDTGASESRRMHIFVNHHPSKFSGAKASAEGRELAMAALRSLCDSVAAVSGEPIVAMGDFNDTPDAGQFSIVENRLKNLAEPLSERGEGSIKFEGRWSLIDHFLVGNCGSAETGWKMTVLQPPFLMVRDRSYSGFKPFRTYVGPRYGGGVSDHLPVFLRVIP